MSGSLNGKIEARRKLRVLIVEDSEVDALLMERLPFKRNVRRLPIFGLGCVGGAVGLARAATMAASEPGSVVLFLVIELCALWFRRDDLTKSNIVATALFGDGAAGVVLSTDAQGPAIISSGEHTFPGSGWRRVSTA